MPSKTFNLDSIGPLDLEWDKGWINMRVHVNNMAVGLVPTKEELEEGRSFKLRNGANLHIQRRRKMLSLEKELLINLDGKPVTGTNGDPLQKIYTAVIILLFLGLFNIILGILPYFIKSIHNYIDTGYYTFLFGLAYFIVTIWLARYKTALSLSFAILLVVCNMSFLLYMVYITQGRFIIKGTWVTALLVIALVRSFPALKMIKEENEENEG